VRSEDSKILRAPIYWAHRAVFFAIAQLSCYILYYSMTSRK